MAERCIHDRTCFLVSVRPLAYAGVQCDGRRGVAPGEPDPNLTRRHGDALEYCLRELSREHPDYQAAQVYATLSVEEALRDLATAIGWAADRLR